MARRKLKRRISWQLPAQETNHGENESLDVSAIDCERFENKESSDFPNQTLSNENSATPNQSLSNENSAMSNQTLTYKNSATPNQSLSNEDRAMPNQTSLNENRAMPNQTRSNENLAKPNHSLLNKSGLDETMDDCSMIPLSILEKLNDTELLKRYLTPRQPKDSSSYVEGHVSGSFTILRLFYTFLKVLIT